MMQHVRTLKAKRRARVLPYLLRLAKKGAATASEFKASSVEAAGLEREGLIRRIDVRQSGKRGRPAYIYKLTSMGQKRVNRAQAA